jgi:hypothetical protein
MNTGMRFEDFEIGQFFFTGTGAWYCTDKGTRVVVAIQAKMSAMVGPPYDAVETVFDEHDFGGCSTEPFDIPEPDEG